MHGAINILWVKTAYSVEDFARRHLADLQAAAREIIPSLGANRKTLARHDRRHATGVGASST